MAKTKTAVEEPKLPLEVKLVAPDAPKNPYVGKFPRWDEEVPKRLIKFSYLQQPGTNIEFDKGRTVIKADGRPGNVNEHYDLKDGEEYELPVDVIKHLNNLIYLDAGHKKPRCMCVEV